MSGNDLSRRALLGAFAGLPALAVAGAGNGFASDPALTAPAPGFASVGAEAFAAPVTTLDGRLPPGLSGVLWRNGPAEHERFGHRYGHWFDGDGMAQAFVFSEGGAFHRARVLDTPKRRRETEAGKRILPTFSNPGSEPVAGPDDMNVANTAMLVHAGRLMALWEGGSALEVDPETLEAGRFAVWRPDLAGAPFSAHPKAERDGTLWNIGFATRPRPRLLFYRIDRHGNLVDANAVDAGPLGMTHDFAVTARHLVVLLTPFVLEPDLWASGRVGFLDAHVWRPGLGVRVLTVDKDTLEPVRRCELPPGFHFHHGNGWEERDGTIRLDLCQAPDPDFATRDLRAVMRGETGPNSAHPRYRGVVLSPDGGATTGPPAPGVAEFPRIDPRRTGRRHRKVFALVGDGAREGWPFRGIARFDPERGEVDRWTYPPDTIPEEHVFAPRGGAEGDGWLIGPWLDVGRGASGVSVFDAGRVSEGPVWRGVLPYPLPLGLHGAFAAS